MMCASASCTMRPSMYGMLQTVRGGVRRGPGQSQSADGPACREVHIGPRGTLLMHRRAKNVAPSFFVGDGTVSVSGRAKNARVATAGVFTGDAIEHVVDSGAS